MVGVASLELPDGGVLGQLYTIQLQLGVPSWMAHIGRMLGLPTFHRGGPPSFLSCFLLFGVFLKEQLPSSIGFFSFLFFFKFGMGSKPIEKRGGEGGGSARGSWDPEASLRPAPYPSGGRAALSFCCPAASCLPL